MGISLLDCIDPDPKKACENIYNKITTKAANLVPTVEPVSYTHLDVYKRQHHDVGAAQYLSYSFQILALHHCTGGVVGKRHDEQLGAGGDSSLEGIGTQAELVLLSLIHI